jgi:hypothetical protein
VSPSERTLKKFSHLLDNTLLALDETVVHSVVQLHDRGLIGIAPKGIDLRATCGITGDRAVNAAKSFSSAAGAPGGIVSAAVSRRMMRRAS